MLKRSHYIALGLVVVLTLIVLSLPAHTAGRLKLAIGSLFLPLFGLANSSEHAVDKASEAITPPGELIKENDALRRQNQQLQIEATQSREIARENSQLRQLLNWKQKAKGNLKLANVVLRDPANWWRTVQIDLGSRDGVRVNLPVLTTNGLVGKVSAVMLDRSQVVLLGDANCKVSAVVENDTRDKGVIGTSDPLDNSLVALVFPFGNANLKAGQNVLTSGLGGFYPAGIPIGKIVDTRAVDYGFTVEARVKLAANLSGLEEVWVLWP
jgi:rod shape-determining protein MreC